MRQLTIILTLFITTILTACGQTKSFGDKKVIDLTTVDFIEIRNHSGQADTIQTVRKRLTNEQAKLFIDKWNNAKSNGPCKYIVLYWIDITMKDGTKRTFRINGENIKESNDYCFDLGDNKFAETLWTMTK